MQQRRRNKPCPDCGKPNMRAGVLAGGHGKVSGRTVCDECVIKSIYARVLDKPTDDR